MAKCLRSWTRDQKDAGSSLITTSLQMLGHEHDID